MAGTDRPPAACSAHARGVVSIWEPFELAGVYTNEVGGLLKKRRRIRVFSGQPPFYISVATDGFWSSVLPGVIGRVVLGSPTRYRSWY